jgi:NDP-sugar pyrophosphorylase family protein
MRRTIDAILLCGGSGLRLRGIIGDVPKAMASIGGHPFLEVLLKQLRRYGFQRVILAVGYQKDVIRSHFGQRAFDLSLEYSEEKSPLGTGGALRKAADLVESDNALIMNGDSYTDADLRGFAVDHCEAGTDASVLVVPADQRSDCGLVSVGEDGSIVQFREKQRLSGSQYINAGIYAASRSILCEIPAGLKVSLEEELFPQWLASGKSIKAFVVSGACVDIGTPERYQQAQCILANADIEGIALRSADQRR